MTNQTTKKAQASPGNTAAAAPPRPNVSRLSPGQKPPVATTHGKTVTSTSAGPRPGTLTLHLSRIIKAPAERIYQCFLDPDAYAKWLPPHGFSGTVHKMEAKVGGTYSMSFQTINRSWSHTFGGKYTELVPGKRIVHTDAFEEGPSAPAGTTMKVTIDFTKVPEGTRLDITQEGIPEGPMADGSPIGWGQSLDNLANLCEQELPF